MNLQNPSAVRYVRSLDYPDEVQTFPFGSGATVRLGDLVIGRVVCDPGWHWAEQLKSVAGTASCEFHHVGFGVSGELRFRMDDGPEFSIVAGDVFDIPPGHDVWVVGDEPAVVLMWAGWRGFGKLPTGDRVLTTMVFTDIVGSTELAADIGDLAWDQLLDHHNSLIREILEEYRGNEIETTGDGFLMTFDGAARAIRATVAMRQAVARIGQEIRCAVHSGEVEVVAGNIRGLAVHEAARILAVAGAGEILVSSTTRELAEGSGLRFADRGRHHLKGVPNVRQLFAVDAVTSI